MPKDKELINLNIKLLKKHTNIIILNYLFFVKLNVGRN